MFEATLTLEEIWEFLKFFYELECHKATIITLTPAKEAGYDRIVLEPSDRFTFGLLEDSLKTGLLSCNGWGKKFRFVV